MDSLLGKHIEELQQLCSVEQYDACIQSLNQLLYAEGYHRETIQKVKIKGTYTVNKSSDVSTKENMMKVKESLIFYLENMICSTCSMRF